MYADGTEIVCPQVPTVDPIPKDSATGSYVTAKAVSPIQWSQAAVAITRVQMHAEEKASVGAKAKAGYYGAKAAMEAQARSDPQEAQLADGPFNGCVASAAAAGVDPARYLDAVRKSEATT